VASATRLPRVLPTTRLGALMYESILVPLDGSPAGEQALPMATSIAERTGARLELAIVRADGAPPYLLRDTPPPDSPADRDRRIPLRDYIEAVASRLQQRVPEVTCRLLEGEIAPALIAHAGAGDATLIVMTTHGRGGISRAWLGSVAERIVREVAVPVLMRRPGESGLGIDFAPRRLLVPLDESAVSETVLPRAAALAEPFGAELVLLRVVEPLILRARIVTSPAVEVDEEDLQRQADRAEKYLGTLVDRLTSGGVRAVTRLAAHDQAARGILQAAGDVNADVIAMATHGYGGLRRVMLGSVADKVLRGAEIPLLLYRPPKV
jgi:nucleotide-binding universal stress UspA family protein